MHRILEGVRVLDLTQFFSGPQATLYLAGLGAEVIRIDSPTSADTASNAPPYAGAHGVAFERRSPDDIGVNFLKRGRGKKAICLDLKRAEGLELFMRLVEQADVVVENFSVGVTARLGVNYEAVHARNPRIVYCALTGYGSTGPDAGIKAYDVTVQAAAGLMSVTGLPGQPPMKAGTALSDAIAGTFAMSGVVAALYDREKTGVGQFVDVSMVDCLFSLLFDDPIDWYEQLGTPVRQGNRILRFSPVNTYQALDGWVVLGAATFAQWSALLAVMKRIELLDHPDWSRVEWRVANNREVDDLVQKWVAGVSVADAVNAVREAGAIAAAIHGPRELARWQQLRERGMYESLEHPTLGKLNDVGAAGFPLKFSNAETGYQTPAALARTHNHEVLGELLGLDANELAHLEDDGII